MEKPGDRPTGTGRPLRLAAVATAIGLAAAAWLLSGLVGYRGQAAAGALCFIAIVAACSPNLRLVNWRTVLWGMALQLGFALLILKFEIGGRRPLYDFFSAVANGVKRFLEFTDVGSEFVFGVLSEQPKVGAVFGPQEAFIFAFVALPTIIFI